ncbi:MAG: hypothetical protein RJA56_624 [Pseudomonadota bacterium]
MGLARYDASPTLLTAPMFHIVLVEPEIPPNTGNVIRLCANTGCTLHLVEPLGFSMDDKHMRRAGLDYHEYTHVQRHANWSALIQAHDPPLDRMFAMTTRGSHNAFETAFAPGDWLVFGSETQGLKPEMREHRNTRPQARNARTISRKPAPAIAHAGRSTQPEPVERRGRHHL